MTLKGQKRKRPGFMTLERKSRWFGYVFLAPWILGLVAFFIVPFFKSVGYSFQEITIGKTGLITEWVGLTNYKYMLYEEANFVRQITEEIKGLFTSAPIILVFSLLISLLLNQRFKGRILARSLFFIPVVVASSLVINVIQSDVFTNNSMSGDEAAIFQVGIVADIMENMQINSSVVNFLTTAVSQIFDLTWKSGVQILLFLSALQRIPVTYYEVASVEGANAWEAFWKITFPVLAPNCILVTVYTIIDTFTSSSNTVMKSIITRFNDMKYGYASASAAVYFLVILAVLGVIMLVFGRKVDYSS
ncbi:MAG: sugar ABC transporter permease [Clostridia bacterium]|nr:sugar ABC transporter permease [Clostridia bacterium]